MDTTNFIFSVPVAIADPSSHADAHKIIDNKNNPEQVDPIAREEFDVKYRGDYELSQVKPEAGLILVNGNKQGAIIFQDNEYPNDPAMAIAILFDLKVEDDVIIPSVHGVVAGEEFQGVLKFRRNREGCCAKTQSAMSALVILEHGGSIKWAERHTVFTKDTCKGLFENSPGQVVQDNAKMGDLLKQAQAYKPSPTVRLASSLMAAPQ